jgi:hypothetical protein
MLLLIPVTGAKTIKNRTHLDLTTEAEDHDAEISRLLALGANREQCLRTVDEGRGGVPSQIPSGVRQPSTCAQATREGKAVTGHGSGVGDGQIRFDMQAVSFWGTTWGLHDMRPAGQPARQHTDRFPHPDPTDLRERLAPHPGGQRVAGSNPAVPTITCRSEGVPGTIPGLLLILGEPAGSQPPSGPLRGPGLLLEVLVHGRRALVSAGRISCR